MSLTQGDLTDRQYYSLHERGVRAAVLDALWASDLPPTTMLHVRRIQTGNVAGLGEGRRVSCEE